MIRAEGDVIDSHKKEIRTLSCASRAHAIAQSGHH